MIAHAILGRWRGPAFVAGLVLLLSTHKSKRTNEAIKARGAEVIFLPRYPPDFNSIEGAWSKLKAYLRRGPPLSPKRP